MKKINKSELLKYEDNLVQFRANQDKIESYLLLGLIPLAAIVIVMITIVYFKHDREYKIDGISKMTRNLPSDHTPAEVGYLTYMGKNRGRGNHSNAFRSYSKRIHYN